MKELGPASGDQMVLSFLRAEIDSPSRGPLYMNAIQALRLDRTALIDRSDLNDAHANCARALVLGAVRGYGRGDLLFSGFPSDITWRRVSLDQSEFGSLRYLNSPPWIQFTSGSLLVSDCARNVPPDLAPMVADISGRTSKGGNFEDLILVDDLDGSLIILEGNNRATAFVSMGTSSFSALIGTSPSIKQWTWL